MSAISAYYPSTPNLPARLQRDDAADHVQVRELFGRHNGNPIKHQGASPRPGPVLLMDSVSISVTQGEKNRKPGELTPTEEKLVEELKARDQEVRRHEEAHARTGAPYTGRPSYEFQRGPDGHQYAVGGEVSIDTAPIAGDPEATIRKMEVVKRAASAPSEPSGQDRAVAAQADAQMQAARAELQEQRAEERLEQTAGSEEQTSPYAVDFARSAQAYAHTAAVVAA